MIILHTQILFFGRLEEWSVITTRRIFRHENLKFKDHVNLISANISKTIGLLYKLSKIFPSENLRMLYHTLVLPHITYGIDIWFGAADNVLEHVIVLQKKNYYSYELPSF